MITGEFLSMLQVDVAKTTGWRDAKLGRERSDQRIRERMGKALLFSCRTSSARRTLIDLFVSSINGTFSPKIGGVLMVMQITLLVETPYRPISYLCDGCLHGGDGMNDRALFNCDFVTSSEVSWVLHFAGLHFECPSRTPCPLSKPIGRNLSQVCLDTDRHHRPSLSQQAVKDTLAQQTYDILRVWFKCVSWNCQDSNGKEITNGWSPGAGSSPW